MRLPMSRASIILVCALGLVSAPVAVTQKRNPSARVSAEQLVRDSATALSKLRSYELNVAFDQSIDDGKYRQTSRSYVDTWFEQSGARRRIRIVSKKRERSETIVSDGNGYWVYHDDDRRYERRTDNLPPELYTSPTPGFSGSLSAANLPTSMQSAEVLRQETLSVGGRPELCDVVLVHLKPHVAPPGITVRDNHLTLWVSHRYRVPMKVSATFLHQDPDGKLQAADMVIVVEKFDPNVQLPPSTWTFIPPTDSRPESDTSPSISK